MGEHSFDDALLDVVMISGAKRVINDRRLNTCALIPDCPIDGFEVDHMQRMYAAATPQSLQIYHMELLKRAKALVDFIDLNVGATIEYPLLLQAESDEASELLETRVDALRCMTGLLLDL